MNDALWLAFTTIAVALLFWGVARRRPTPARSAAPVRFTRHARARMILRDVAEADVLATIAKPDRVIRDQIENSVRLEADHGDRSLKVWVAEPWPSSIETIVKSTAWHYRTTITIAPEQVGRLIGSKGRTVQTLRDETGAHINVDGLTVTITAGDRAAMEHALRRVTAIATPRWDLPSSPKSGRR